MRLKAINTTKLFGLFNHVVPLNLDERITIIHGPNGYGKTAILRIVSAFFNKKFSVLLDLPYESITLEFDNSEEIRIRKRRENREHPHSPHSIVIEHERSHFTISGLPGEIANIPPHVIDDILPFLSRIGAREWLDDRTGETLSLSDIAFRYAEHLPTHIRPHAQEMPGWLKQFIDGFTVHYIQAHRLEASEKFPRINRRERYLNATPAVTIYAADLAQRIQETLAKYAELSQSLDRTFPHRLVTYNKATPSRQLLQQQLQAIEDRQKKLTEVNLLDKERSPFSSSTPALDDSKLDVLSIYAEDAQQKLGVFDELYQRISLFQKLINKRFLFKSMSIDKQGGFLFKTRDQERLDATSLSTGEQHELVLLYEMLFRVGPNALIVVDEPEISLHIAWQEQFLEDLHEVTQLSKFDILIATHSPQIISDRWDLTVELQSPPDA